MWSLLELRGQFINLTCSNGPGHVTNMAAIPADSKHLYFFSVSGTHGPIALELDLWHLVLEKNQDCSNSDLELTLIFL